MLWMMMLIMIWCVFVGEVKDYISRAEQLKQLLKPNHTDTCDGAPPPRELGLLYKCHDQRVSAAKLFACFCTLHCVSKKPPPAF